MKATQRAVDEQTSAPTVLSLPIDKKTTTTMRLSGMPNRFMMAPRCSSGSSLERRVPMVGKYTPTQASKAKKARLRESRALFDAASVARLIAVAPTASIDTAIASADIPAFMARPNAEDPSMQHAMKQEKTAPKGTDDPEAAHAATAVLRAGGHTRTNVYIAPSKAACTAPTSIMRLSATIAFQAAPTRSSSLGPSTGLASVAVTAASLACVLP
mmetsp:Transcript_39359/g.97225  ORF Transcript_39359/g.97225 Transcript_39359/m.97225 type:complete len:214 (-) Transcript_39359:943-1584(-)